MALRQDLLHGFAISDTGTQCASPEVALEKFYERALPMYLVLRKYAGLFMGLFLTLTRAE